MTRLIRNMVADIGRLTRFSEPVAHRICFLRGARNGILSILALRTAPTKLRLLVNTANCSPKDLAKELQSKEIKASVSNEFKDVVEVQIPPRIKITNEGPVINEELPGAEKLSEDYVQKNGIKTVTVRRNAAIDAAMGKDIVSTDIVEASDMSPGDEVVIIDKYKTIVASGVANMSEEEAKRSPGRVAIKVTYPLYDVPDFSGLKSYRRGDFSVFTLPRILGFRNVLIHASGDSPRILVVSQDNGEIAAHLHHAFKGKAKITILARNEGHIASIQNTFERLGVGEDIQIIREELERMAKRRGRKGEKFNVIYYEPACSKSGQRPSFFSEIEEKTIISMHRSQFQGIRSIALLGETSSPIIYVTHSIDPTENQEVISLALKQGIFELSSDKKYLKLVENYPSEIDILPEIPTATLADSAKINQILSTPSYRRGFIEVDPIRDDADAGFVATMLLKPSRRGRRRGT